MARQNPELLQVLTGDEPRFSVANASLQRLRIGCLAPLLFLALIGFCVEYFGEAQRSDGGEGGGRLAIMGFMWLLLFFIIFGGIAAFRALRGKLGQPRGFPVILNQPPNDRD